VLAGYYNVVPTDLDIYPTKSWANDALLQPESRAAFQRLLDQGWTDAIRTLHPSEPMYTFCDYKPDRWQRNAGPPARSPLAQPATGKPPGKGRGRSRRPRAGRSQ
jgi:exodeoxyribonuclease-3